MADYNPCDDERTVDSPVSSLTANTDCTIDKQYTAEKIYIGDKIENKIENKIYIFVKPEDLGQILVS